MKCSCNHDIEFLGQHEDCLVNGFTGLQWQVIYGAKEVIGAEDWYRGICTDSMPSNLEIRKVGITEAIACLALDSESWDNPNFPN